MKLFQISLLLFTNSVYLCNAAAADIVLDAKAQSNHRLDSLNLLSYTLLLILTVLTIWLFKHRRVSFLHETGLAVIYGLIVGAIIRYAGSSAAISNMNVYNTDEKYNDSLPPDSLTLHFPIVRSDNIKTNKTYQYTFRSTINVEDSEIELKATFDPEIFFNIILPPIIFHAGYSLKRKYFFRNLGAILTYAIIGTTISSFVIGALMYGCVQLMPARMASSFTFLDTLYFGALISSTDPLTILAIFHDLHVDVNLYALVFGESVLNDAVAIVLSGSIQNYGDRYGGFETEAFFRSLGLRGAMSFALAIRNTVSEARQAMLTTTSLIVIVTVIIQGGASMNLLRWFKIPVGIDEETEALSTQGTRSVYNSMECTSAGNSTPRCEWPDISADPLKSNEKAFLARVWGSFDTHYMKPLLTHARPTLLETLPVCCNPLARLLTTTEQMTQEGQNKPTRDSDSDLCIEESDYLHTDPRQSNVHREQHFPWLLPNNLVLANRNTVAWS
ncbi:hypothetical protein FQA39_LY09836 [Lamprigera yunnana]|nr:hypothetical protein FQA39_LY09836 [Lamprigera yunnana]